MDCLSIFINKQQFFWSTHSQKVYQYITCDDNLLWSTHYLLWSDLINNNSPWKLVRPDLNLSDVSISMDINDSVQIFKDSISREILELTIVSKSWIVIVCISVWRSAHNLAGIKLNILVFHDTHFCQIWQMLRWLSTPCFCMC